MASMFNFNGAPTGYGQISPFRKRTPPTPPDQQAQIIQRALEPEPLVTLMAQGANNPALPALPRAPAAPRAPSSGKFPPSGSYAGDDIRIDMGPWDGTPFPRQ